MRALALDLGTTAGWATYIDGSICSGVQSFAFNARYEGGGMRYLKFQRWLDTMHELCTFNQCYFEEVMQRPLSIAAGHVYGGLLATLTAWCELKGIPYSGVPVKTIKLHATGKGNAGKEQMIAAAKARGYAPKDDNEADALCIIHWLLDHAATSTPNIGHTSDRKPPRRIPVVVVPPTRRRIKV